LQWVAACCSLLQLVAAMHVVCFKGWPVAVKYLNLGTHCNAMQHTALDYPPHLQLSTCVPKGCPSQYNGVARRSTMGCSTVQCVAVGCSVLQCVTAQACSIPQGALLQLKRSAEYTILLINNTATHCSTLQQHCNTLQNTELSNVSHNRILG